MPGLCFLQSLLKPVLSYLFAHDSMQKVPTEGRLTNMYWKGRVKAIKQAQGRVKRNTKV